MDHTTHIPSGFKMTFENGNTISVQFGWGNYCENRGESKPGCVNAEIAIWDSENKWFDFGSDSVKDGVHPMRSLNGFTLRQPQKYKSSVIN